MTNRKSFFTYLCYILFALCTLIYIALFFDGIVINDSPDNGLFFSRLALIITAFAIIIMPPACFILSIIFHRRKNPDRLNYMNTSHRMYEYVIETVFVAVLFIITSALRALFMYYSYPFIQNNLEYVITVLVLNNSLYIAAALFMYLSIRIACGRLAGIISVIIALFILVEYIMIYFSSATKDLITAALLWGIFLWFVIFYKKYTCDASRLKNSYISISLLGAASNLLIFGSYCSIIIVFSIFVFLLFKYWKHAFLYILFSLPVIGVYIYDIVMRFTTGASSALYRSFDINVHIPFVMPWELSDYYWDISFIIYILIYVFAFIAVILMIEQRKNVLQILMLYVVATFVLNRPGHTVNLFIYTALMSYAVQSVYSSMVRKRCLKYGTVNEKYDETAAVYEENNRSDSENDISYIIPVTLSDDGQEYKIHANEEYKGPVNENVKELWAMRKQRIMRKHNK